MKATDMLRKDHEKVDGLFERFEKAKTRAARKRIFEEIHTELDVHAKLEEAIFYPAVREIRDVEGRSLVKEAFEEHADVKRLLAEIAALHVEDEAFGEKVDELREDVEHHVE